MQSPDPTIPQKDIFDRFIEGTSKGLQAYQAVKNIGSAVEEVTEFKRSKDAQANLGTLLSFNAGIGDVDDARKALTELAPYQDNPKVKDIVDTTLKSLNEENVFDRELTQLEEVGEDREREVFNKVIEQVDNSKESFGGTALNNAINTISSNIIKGNISRQTADNLYQVALRDLDDVSGTGQSIIQNSYQAKRYSNAINLLLSKPKSVRNDIEIKKYRNKLDKLGYSVTPEVANEIGYVNRVIDVESEIYRNNLLDLP